MRVILTGILSGGCAAMLAAAPVAAHLPGELSAESVLNGAYPYPASPVVPVQYRADGLAAGRLGEVPSAGIHPRLLFGPGDLPGLRQRLESTEAGKAMVAKLRQRVDTSVRRADGWEAELYDALKQGDSAKAAALLDAGKKPNGRSGHYQPYFLYELVLHMFDNLVFDRADDGRAAAAALDTYGKIIEPRLDELSKQPLNDDVWRVRPAEGAAQFRNLLGYHLFGYAYDFGWKFMTEEQRARARRIISKATSGKVWLGARLPHHFRNWNWCAVGLSQPLLALAIEGEEGYDPRVYRMGVEIARDYLTHGISAKGSSTEAVGYTQFGFVWGMPFIAAAARRGENLLTHSHYRAMPDWYIHSLEPYGGKWTSHGDGGDGGPSMETLMMWGYFYPQDGRIPYLWRNFRQSVNGKPYDRMYHMIEPMVWASDIGSEAATPPAGTPPTFFDPDRSSLNARSGWEPEAAAMQFECRTDSVGGSHEHADRGNFTFAALGRSWAKENFRSVETRFHNNVVIDNRGQGFWPGAGVWLGMRETPWGVIAGCEMADAYRWMTPKPILNDAPESPRFQYPRWENYRSEAAAFQKEFEGVPREKVMDAPTRAAFAGFGQGDPRFWDEDGWPVRYKLREMEYAWRSVFFGRGAHPYLLVVDDIRQDDAERLYEWLMQTGLDTELLDAKDHTLTLATRSQMKLDRYGRWMPEKGSPLLLVVRLDEPSEAAAAKRYAVSNRLESFERKDAPGMGGRSFGADRRLVLPKLADKGDFKVLLIPIRQGEKPPKIDWNAGSRTLVVAWPDQSDRIVFRQGEKGRTRFVVERDGKESMENF